MLFLNLAVKPRPLHSLYNLSIRLAEKLLPISGFFSEKMKLFVEGRKKVFSELRARINAGDEVIWLHAASLGEYEQAVPVIEGIKQQSPHYKLVLTFFSPSGYEIKKNSELVDVITYLPLDTKKNAREFLEIVHPKWALFIKYEFWPNLLKELQNRQINTLLISGAFREDQIFFRSYGKWMRSYLSAFQHFFVQNEKSRQLLRTIGLENVTISGDTRFDRVARQLEQNNTLSFIEEFLQEKLCVVAGSTWPEDEQLLLEHINNDKSGIKYIIAPHTISPARINQLKDSITRRTVLFSEKEGKNLSEDEVMIIDTIGLLTKIYSYADIAYVGGAAGTSGLHNILEPATFATPIIIGNNFSRFPEAIQLKEVAGLYSVSTKEQLHSILSRLIEDEDFRRKTGEISGEFVKQHTGASKIITTYLQHQKDS